MLWPDLEDPADLLSTAFFWMEATENAYEPELQLYGRISTDGYGVGCRIYDGPDGLEHKRDDIGYLAEDVLYLILGGPDAAKQAYDEYQLISDKYNEYPIDNNPGVTQEEIDKQDRWMDAEMTAIDVSLTVLSGGDATFELWMEKRQ